MTIFMHNNVVAHQSVIYKVSAYKQVTYKNDGINKAWYRLLRVR